MELIQHSEYIYSTTYETKRDRPSLGYIKGSNFSVMADAGTSAQHVKEAYALLKERQLPLPAFTILTHWHWDHTFGMHAVQGLTIAHTLTNRELERMMKWQWNPEAMQERLISQEEIPFVDDHLKIEYNDLNEIKIKMADISFSSSMTLDQGNSHVQLFHVPSPHSDDSVFIYVSQAKVLFIGDAICEDYYHQMNVDQSKLQAMIKFLQALDFEIGIQGHLPAMNKTAILNQAYALIK